MIKRIQSIKNFGVYQNYKFNNIKDFNDKNIFYGWNYSGKTTLSRLFSFLGNKKIDNEEFSSMEFEIILEDKTKINHTNIGNFPYEVKVFNADFIKENLRFDSEDKKMKGITFDIGENAHLRPLIKLNEEYIINAKSKITTNSTFISKFNDFSNSKFTNQAKIIKNDHFNSLIEFNKSHLEKLIETEEKTISNLIEDTDLIAKVKADSISKNDKENIELKDLTIGISNLIVQIIDFISSEPKKTSEEKLLDEDSELYSWVKKGMELHETKKLSNCAFCNFEYDKVRITNLNSYYSNEAAKLKEKSVEIIEILETEKQRFSKNEIFTISKNDINESLQSKFIELMIEYSNLVKTYVAKLEELEEIIHDKLKNSLFVAKDMPILDLEIELELTKWFKNFKDLIEQHNLIVTNFKTNQDSSREKYKKHLIAQFLIDNNYFEIKRKKEIEEKYHLIFNKSISIKSEQNKDYTDKLKSITAGKKELNDFIKLFLRREDIQIDVVENEYFVLKRGEIIAKNLSEGEKTSIAFSHFMVLLNSLNTDGKLLNSIIFVDDPISSLDANHIAQISSLINSFFFRKGLDAANPKKVVDCFLQLFISTHNFEFYSFLRDANNIKRKKKVQNNGNTIEVSSSNYYLIKKESLDSSIILDMPKSLSGYKSEYIYLFSIIYNFLEENCSEENSNYILMPNAVRRFLEIYTLIKLPGNDGEIDSRIKELVGEVNELKILHHFSHFTTFEKATKHDELLLKLPDLVADVFTLLEKDETHYKSLCQALNKPIFSKQII